MATWADWGTLLAQTGLGITPAELHGSLAGYLCARGDEPAGGFMAALALESANAHADHALSALLDATAADIQARWQSGDAVEPLLPMGNVATRADAMVEWCRGFLGGLGLAGVLGDHAQDADSDSVIADLGQIASRHLTSDDDDEAALAEVLDFIRGAILHLRLVLASAPRS